MNLIRLLALAVLAYGGWRFAQGLKAARTAPEMPGLHFERLCACRGCGLRMPATLMDANLRCRDCRPASEPR